MLTMIAKRSVAASDNGKVPCPSSTGFIVAIVHLALFALVVGGRNLGEQDDVGERLRRVVADERLASFRDDRLVEVDSFLEVLMHGRKSYPSGPVPRNISAPCAG